MVFERLISLRRKKPVNEFKFEKLPKPIRLRILQNLSNKDLASVAACSRESERLVNENRELLKKYALDKLYICFDPMTDAACLRGTYGKYSVQSVVLNAKSVIRYFSCIHVRRGVTFELGSFVTTMRGDHVISVYQPMDAQTLDQCRLSVPQLKRVVDFLFELDNLISALMKRSWSHCEKFRVDSLILFFHERLYYEKSRSENKSIIRRLSSRFSKTSHEKLAHFCRKGRNELAERHHCSSCLLNSIVSVDFPKVVV